MVINIIASIVIGLVIGLIIVHYAIEPIETILGRFKRR